MIDGCLPVQKNCFVPAEEVIQAGENTHIYAWITGTEIKFNLRWPHWEIQSIVRLHILPSVLPHQ